MKRYRTTKAPKPPKSKGFITSRYPIRTIKENQNSPHGTNKPSKKRHKKQSKKSKVKTYNHMQTRDQRTLATKTAKAHISNPEFNAKSANFS